MFIKVNDPLNRTTTYLPRHPNRLFLAIMTPLILGFMIWLNTPPKYEAPYNPLSETPIVFAVEPTPTATPTAAPTPLTPRLSAHKASKPDVYAAIENTFGADAPQAGELIARESSFNPEAINPTSGACGLAQALPCEKMACPVENTPEAIDCQLRWIKTYVENRYGSMDKAIEFHDTHNWY